MLCIVDAQSFLPSVASRFTLYVAPINYDSAKFPRAQRVNPSLHVTRFNYREQS